jgi:hypothetical protein
MPEDLIRAAAVLAEQMSVAKVASGLNVNHTRISHAVALLRNERLPLFPTSSRTHEHEGVPAGKNLTFTKVDRLADPEPPRTSSAHSEFSDSMVHAKLCFPGGLYCDVTSLSAFRILCKTILKGTC